MTGPRTEAAASAGEIDACASAFILAKHDLGAWGEEDQAELDAWLDVSFAHRTAYWRLEAAWERADRLNALRPLSSRGNTITSDRRFRGPPLKIAAATVLIAAIAAGVWNMPTRDGNASYATPVGAHERIKLADGTRIELNTNSELRLESDPQNRVVRLLRGEAFFEVHHDAGHPFVVLARGHRIVDLGTKFVVREENGTVRVSLVEGSARLESGAVGSKQNTVVLRPGDVALATLSSITVHKEQVEALQTRLGWRRGVLVFHHAELSEVAAEYNRYNERQIVIADPEIAKLTISATLPTGDIDGFARMAQNFLGLRIRKEPGKIQITR